MFLDRASTSIYYEHLKRLHRYTMQIAITPLHPKAIAPLKAITSLHEEKCDNIATRKDGTALPSTAHLQPKAMTSRTT